MIFVLVFGVFYPLMALAVLCACVFGISVSMPDIRAKSIEYGKKKWNSPIFSIFQAEAAITPPETCHNRIVVLSLLGSVLWPVAAPLWLSWTKGQRISDVLEVRKELSKGILT